MDVRPLQLTVHSHLGSPDAPARAWARSEHAEVGRRDFAYAPRELAATYVDQGHHRSMLVLAHDGDRCVGVAHVDVPDADNRHLLAIDFRVEPERDVDVVLDALWSVIEELAVNEARDTVVAWVHSGLPEEGSLAPRTGSGAVRRTPMTDWLMARGFVLEQVEIASTLDVAATLVCAWDPESKAVAASPDHLLVSWMGPTPPELREAMAAQRARMSSDVPLGQIAMEPKVWDAARVRAEDEVMTAKGWSMI